MKILLAAAFLAGFLPIGVGPPKSAPDGGSARRSPRAAASDMTFHGGWVMRTTTNYAIYWVPPGYTCGASDPGCTAYLKAVDRYFKDVAAASGSDSNVYSVAAQYYDGTGAI